MRLGGDWQEGAHDQQRLPRWEDGTGSIRAVLFPDPGGDGGLGRGSKW